jgi:type VI secretion system protein ImpL
MRWVAGLLRAVIGLLATALLIWWASPSIAIGNLHPFESETIRYILIAVLAMVPVARRFASAPIMRWAAKLLIDRRVAATIGSVMGVLVLATVVWEISYLHNYDYLVEVERQYNAVKKQVETVPGGVQSDLSALMPILTSVRTLAETRVTSDGSVPWSWRFGLYQGGKLQAASQMAYQRMLRDTFLPSIVSYLETNLRQSTGAQDDYDAVKTYVMLYDPKHFDRDAVWRWYQIHSEQLLPGAGPSPLEVTKTHFYGLYARGWVDPPLLRDDALLVRVQSMISRDSLPKQVYDRLKLAPIPDVNDFTIAEKVGPQSTLVFARRSGEPITKGIPGLYTKDGYYKFFRNRSDITIVKQIDEAAWVLGTAGKAQAVSASGPEAVVAVKRLYLDDYRGIWRQFIADITVIGDRNLARTIEITRILSSPSNSPLKLLVEAIARETSLSVSPEGVAGIAWMSQQSAYRARQGLSGGAAGSLEKTSVDDQFEDIHRLAGSGTGRAGIDDLIWQLKEYYQFLVASKTAIDAAQAPPPSDAANRLLAEAARQPEPIRTILQSLVTEQREYRPKRADRAGN